jgi:hypothetical protein
MFKKFAVFILLIAVSSTILAQGTEEKKKGRPDIPGTFAIDLGWNFPSEKAGFNTNVFGSRTLNIYYYYDHRLGKSKFSVHPGIGLGLERYKFNNNKTLGYVSDSVRMVSASGFIGTTNIRKSGLITNYIDIPVEIRFSSNPDDPGRSFKVGLGFKVGILYDSFTKIKYSQDGEVKKLKNKQNYDINPFRYGVTLRVGAGPFSVYSYYSLTPVFRKLRGPEGAEITNFTVGLTLAAF